MAGWDSYRIVFYVGLVLMLGFWVTAVIGLMFAATLMPAYNATCTYQPPPLTTPAECGRLAAQMGQAVTVAVLGGVAGLGGMVVAVIGHRGSQRRQKIPGRTEPRTEEGGGPPGPT